jgi:hypothetical protein
MVDVLVLLKDFQPTYSTCTGCLEGWAGPTHPTPESPMEGRPFKSEETSGKRGEGQMQTVQQQGLDDMFVP